MKNQIRYTRGALAAKGVLSENGFKEIINYPLDLFAEGLGATVLFKSLHKSDGRIIFGNRRALIEINKDIQYEPRQRFTLAHEIGHLVMHPGIDVHNDTEASTSWFNSKESQSKTGIVEYEANQFASELLIPSEIFYLKQKGEKFSPDLLRSLAVFFNASITATAFKYFELGDHPICLVHCYNNIVKYWKRPEDYHHYIKDRTKLTPPDDSVAGEFFDNGTVYSKAESAQEIWKSTWFEMKDSEDDSDYEFFEYCITHSGAKMTLSVIWEE